MSLHNLGSLGDFERRMDAITGNHTIQTPEALKKNPVTQSKLNKIIEQFNAGNANAAIQQADPATLARVRVKLQRIIYSYQNQQSPVRKKLNDAVNKLMAKIMGRKAWGSENAAMALGTELRKAFASSNSGKSPISAQVEMSYVLQLEMDHIDNELDKARTAIEEMKKKSDGAILKSQKKKYQAQLTKLKKDLVKMKGKAKELGWTLTASPEKINRTIPKKIETEADKLAFNENIDAQIEILRSQQKDREEQIENIDLQIKDLQEEQSSIPIKFLIKESSKFPGKPEWQKHVEEMGSKREQETNRLGSKITTLEQKKYRLNMEIYGIKSRIREYQYDKKPISGGDV